MENPQTNESGMILLGRRKRSNSSEKNKGKSFIQPSNGKKNPKKKNFFTKSASSLMNPIALLDMVRDDLTDQQAANVAHALDIQNPTKAGLNDFITHLSSNDANTLNYVKELVIKARSSQRLTHRPASVILGAGFASLQPDMPPLTSFPITDIRYRHCEQEQVIMTNAELLGLSPVDKTYTINNIGEGNHVIIQSFSHSVFPQPVRWPVTLTIEINGYCAKAQSNTNLTYIDLTDYLPIFDLHITCGLEGQGFAFMIRVLQFSTFREIADQIKLTKAKEDNIPQFPPMQIFSPLMCKTIEYPCRSTICDHFDCFDLKDYIKLAQKMNRWICPICNRYAPFESLYFSATVDRYLISMKQARPQVSSTSQSETMSISNSPEFNDPFVQSPEPYVIQETPLQQDDSQFDQFTEYQI